MRNTLFILVCGVLVTSSGDRHSTLSPANATELAPVAAKNQKKIPAQEKVSQFMQAKLDSSKQVLEGMMTEDFQQIQKGAQKLIDMSNATQWQVVEGPVFAQQSAEFRSAAKELQDYAKKKNIDGVSLSYLHLTMTCIACHKQIKKTAVVMR
ncbi:hypothetical protein [Gimesia benthica]|uniref:hypothetical protein n=1 Tax=Gimesia benthica TaxID=2608982 RepID=UPI001D159390|nr:hypothetical protein [Gimesia benthica]